MLNGRALDEKSGCVGSNPTWYVEIMKVNKYHVCSCISVGRVTDS